MYFLGAFSVYNLVKIRETGNSKTSITHSSATVEENCQTCIFSTGQYRIVAISTIRAHVDRIITTSLYLAYARNFDVLFNYFGG